MAIIVFPTNLRPNTLTAIIKSGKLINRFETPRDIPPSKKSRQIFYDNGDACRPADNNVVRLKKNV